MPISDALRALLTAPGPSGYERRGAAAFRRTCSPPAPEGRAAPSRDICSPLADEVVTDHVGSTVATLRGRGEGPSVAVLGHIDEIGLIVSHIDDEGLLWFLGVGGWDPMILVGQRVEVVTRDGSIPGVIGKKPIHLLREEERKKS